MKTFTMNNGTLFIGRPVCLLAVLFLSLQVISCAPETQQRTAAPQPLVATSFDTGFEEAGNTWESLSAAPDGKIYYSFSTTEVDQGAMLFSYDPATGEIETVADLTEVSDGFDDPAIPQGKSHGNFYEIDGKLYISTHVGVHGSVQDGELAITREGYRPYQGGHFLSYDLSTGEFEQLAQAPHNEGLLTFTVDRERRHAYAVTWPLGYFLHYDINTGELHNLGLTAGRGEAGTPGDDFRVLSRALVVDQGTGSAYYSTADGDIFEYSPYTNERRKVEGVSLRLDYLGEHIIDRPGSMAFGWRQIFWHEGEEAAYGVHGKSGYLFRFDPREPSLELVERITSVPSRKSGLFDVYYYGYLGFDLGPDGETAYYLTGGPIYVDGVRLNADNNEELGFHRRVRENLHLVTYHIPTGEYRDHGPILDENGYPLTDAQAITFGPDGEIYTLARTLRDGSMVMDLVRIPNPITN